MGQTLGVLIDPQLQELIRLACHYPPGDPRRQRYLTQVIQLIQRSRGLWKEASPYYEDALQLTWVYFCQNICEAGTGEAYDPNRSSVLTWLNRYLKWRLLDGQQYQQDLAKNLDLASIPESAAVWNSSAVRPEVPPILEETQRWAEQDPSGELAAIALQNCPTVTCQMLILRRLPPETSWKELAAETGLAISTLSSFYQRQCLPRLRKFGESQGYL